MIVPGFALASASSSCAVDAPTDGCAVRMSGAEESSATPTKSRRVVGELLVHQRRDDERRRREKERVAVRRCLCHLRGTDRRRGPGPVLDHDRLSHPLGELLPHRHARTSDAPPGANGTTIRIGFDG